MIKIAEDFKLKLKENCDKFVTDWNCKYSKKIIEIAKGKNDPAVQHVLSRYSELLSDENGKKIHLSSKNFEF